MADLTAMLQAAAGQAGEATDPFFNQTTLLLHGDGTNGAQNNTFLDSSTNNFTITRNGNTTQGTFSPFSVADGEFSNYFAPADFISTPNNAAIQLGSSDFTIETWIYVTEHGSIVTGISNNYASTGDQRGWMFNVTASAMEFRLTSAGTFASIVSLSHSATINLNTWYWVAVTRSGTTFSFYVDGTRVGTSTDSTTIFASSAAHQIANGNASSSDARFGGYISNYRLIKGTALYTAATVAVPTAPVTAVANTSVLACQSNRFVDNSSNAFAITVSGTPSVQPFSPFAPSAAYDPSVNGGSGYFDGSGDFLTLASSSDFALGTGDFCIEFFTYITGTLNNFDEFIGVYPAAGNPNGWSIFFYLGVLYFGTHTANPLISPSSFPANNQWIHVAISRSGTTLSGYINGTRFATTTNSTDFTQNGLNIFGKGTGNEPPGYMTNVRVVKGSAIYDPTQTTITVPTAPLTAVSGTELLLNFTNAGIFDNTGKNNLETVGDAQIDTTTKKYGTGSMEFDGVSDELKIPSSNLLDFEGDFTVEFWVYFDTLEDNMRLFNRGLFDSSPNIALATKANGALEARLNNTSNSPTTISSSGVLTTGGWLHIAFVRFGSATDNVNVYVDGSAEITFTETGACNPSANFLIANYPGVDRTPDCFIDDFRITKGIARYTAAFTPPDAPFPDQ